jgi:hypothetical protein
MSLSIQQSLAFPSGPKAKMVGKPQQTPVGVPLLAGRTLRPALTGGVHGVILPGQLPPPVLRFGSCFVTGVFAGTWRLAGWRPSLGVGRAPHRPGGGKQASCSWQAVRLLPGYRGSFCRTKQRLQSERRPGVRAWHLPEDGRLADERGSNGPEESATLKGRAWLLFAPVLWCLAAFH